MWGCLCIDKDDKEREITVLVGETVGHYSKGVRITTEFEMDAALNVPERLSEKMASGFDKYGLGGEAFLVARVAFD